MASSQLSIYQGACLALGERKVVSLSENVPVRKELDGVWDRGGVKTCLQMGLWNFATRAVQLDYSPSVQPTFGYQRAFEKPDDFIRLAQMSASEFYDPPLNRFQDDAGYWFSDIDILYVRYVSSDTDYGFNYSKWPDNFSRLVEHFFAMAICKRVTGGGVEKQELQAAYDYWIRLAKGTDAAEEPTTFPPTGTWVDARIGGRNSGRFSGGYRIR